MGLAIAIIYIPIYVVLAFMAFAIGNRLLVKRSNDELDKEGVICIIITCAALIFITPVTGLAVKEVTYLNNTDFSALFTKMAISNLLPFFSGLIVMIATRIISTKLNNKFIIYASRAGLGFVHGVWIVPIILFIRFIN